MMTRTLSLLLALVVFTGCGRTSSENQNNSGNDKPLLTSLSTEKEQPPAQPADTNPEPDLRAQSIDKSRSNAITNAVEKASPAIVSISVTEVRRGTPRGDDFYNFFFGMPMERQVQSMGSGFIISEDGLVVTNEHVANANSTKIMVALSDGKQYEAELIGSDELSDLSLLKIKENGRSFPHIRFADSDRIMVGEWAIAMGNPFGLFEDGRPSVTVGVVSSKERDFQPDPEDPRLYVDMIQTDAAINSGNSGGPLVNSNGEVIGVNTFIYTGGTSRGFVGLGFAIPSNRVQQIVDQLKNSGQVSLDFDLGMKFQEVTRQLVYANRRIPAVAGLFVTEINKNGPAYEGGIMPGDVIVSIGGKRVSSEMYAWALMREYEEGDEMVVQLYRKGNVYEATLTLRKRVQGR